ncbi:MAG: histidine phosphatase family protein [Actinomycetes bacterium]
MPSKNTIVYLIRHGLSTANATGILAGRDESVHLNDAGNEQARLLAIRLSIEKFDRIYSSPLPRCQETIAPYLEKAKTTAIIEPNFIEMEYGTWSGKKLSKLSKKDMWPTIQNTPSRVRFPHGESFLEMSHRANQALHNVSEGFEKVCIVSHGDVIKAIVAAQLSLSVDHLQKFAVDPASITIISIGKARSTLLKLNDTSHLNRNQESSSKETLGGGAGTS